jgi:NADPH:quinone reductase-like Zn-dependent oxidoreductase
VLLSVSTAASGLFHVLDLPCPSLNPTPTGRSVLIWAGSSSVGSSAVRLARAATAGSANIEYVKSLGASHVFDRKDPDVVGKVLEVLTVGGLIYDTISSQSTQVASGEIFGKLGGGRFALTLPPIPALLGNAEGAFGMCSS